MLRTIAIMTARVMVSVDAPHDQTWINLTTDYVLTGIKYSQALKRWPAFAHPLVYQFLPEYPMVQKQLSDERKMVVKTIEEQEDRERNGIPHPQPLPIIYSMTRKPELRTPAAIEMQLKEQLNLAVGGIHTTSNVLTQTLFELTAHPEYIPDLRAEVIQTLRKHGGSLNKTALYEMSKLDSFIREAHGLNSPNLSMQSYPSYIPCRLTM